MTCGACAARIERKLNRLQGVRASVNFATETARVEYAQPVGVEDLARTVEATGYSVRSWAAPPPPAESRRVALAALLTVPLLVLAMVPPLQFRSWQWVALVLATPVVTWAAWPFHRAAWRAARHATATM